MFDLKAGKCVQNFSSVLDADRPGTVHRTVNSFGDNQFLSRLSGDLQRAVLIDFTLEFFVTNSILNFQLLRNPRSGVAERRVAGADRKFVALHCSGHNGRYVCRIVP